MFEVIYRLIQAIVAIYVLRTVWLGTSSMTARFFLSFLIASFFIPT